MNRLSRTLFIKMLWLRQSMTWMHYRKRIKKHTNQIIHYLFHWQDDVYFKANKIELSLVNIKESKAYFQLVAANRAYLLRWLSWPAQCQSERDMKRLLVSMKRSRAFGKTMDFTIRYDNEIVGMISFNHINSALRKVEIGYWLAEPFQNNGIITQSCEILMDYAFNELNMDKVQISVASHNQSSMKVCNRLGMKQEGILSHAENLHGTIVNHVVFAKWKQD